MSEAPHPHHGRAATPGAVDRGALSTEQRLTASAAMDALSTEQLLRMINTQDMDVPRTVRGAIPAIAKLTEAIVDALMRDGRLIYIGAGTSGRLGVLDASECPPTFHSDPEQVIGLIAGGDDALRNAIEGAEDDESAARALIEAHHVSESDVVVGIAAGGTTPFVWAALNAAQQRHATTGLITCVPLKQLRRRSFAHTVPANAPAPSTSKMSALPCEVDHPVELPVGAEVVTGSTRLKAGTATKLTLNMLTTAAFVRQGKTWGNLMVDLRATSAKLRDRGLRILQQQTDLAPDAAAQVLDQAQGRVKVALVMARLGVEAGAAEQRLAAVDGHLRRILGPPR